jgi:hypothetical protein
MSLKLSGAPISDLYRLLWNIEEETRNKERLKEEEKYKKQLLYNQIENDDQMRADKRKQIEDLMATSNFKVASIMPQVRSLVADKQFEAAGNPTSYSVIGDSTFSAKGGRRTRRHKRSGHKRNKRSGKRSDKSRRR